MKNWLSGLHPRSIWQSYTFLIPFFSVTLFLFFIWHKRNKFTLQRSFFGIHIALVLFIAVDAIQILTMGNKGKYKIVSNTEENIKNCDSCTGPDIYYIVFDAYASSQQLEKEFGYSNYPIEEELKNKGFKIIPDSRSNYNYTGFSVGSVLNMNYIKNVDTVGRTFDRAYLQALKLVHKNSVVSFLRKENYHIYNHSLFDIDSFPSTIQHIDLWGIREIFDQYKLVFKINFGAGYRFPG